ncbi:MAG TPA: type VII secretion integral membrane protein EccD [Candidatus Limnocylindrales bacterium]
MTTPAAQPVAPRRVTVAGPATRVDISLPPQATVAELLPQLARVAAGQPAQQGAAGWTLGRLGAEPLDAASTVASAGIRDGEVLYLFPQDAQPLPVLFDDVAEAVADTVERDPGRWRPAFTRRAGLTVGFLAFAALAALLGFTLPVLGMGLSVALLLVGTFLSRSDLDGTAAVTTAMAGLPGFALAAAQVVVLPGVSWSAPHATAATAAALLYSLGAATLVADGRIWFSGAVLASGIGCVASSLTLVTGWPAMRFAVAVGALGLLCAAALPGIALRIAGVPLPRPPADASALRMDSSPSAGPELTTMTASATHTLGSLLAGLAAIEVGSALILLIASPRWSLALVVLCGLALLLRARAYIHLAQRLPLLAGGGLVLATAGFAVPPVALFAAVFVAGAACMARAVRSEIQASPYWSRLFDVVEFVVLISLVPVALLVLNVYSLL